MALKKNSKFKLAYRDTVDSFGQDCDLPEYDGLLIETNTKQANIIGKVVWDSHEQDCCVFLETDVKLDTYITSYDDFKAFYEIVSAAKSKIAVVHTRISKKR